MNKFLTLFVGLGIIAGLQAQPVADFTFSYGNSGCSPDTVTFTNTSTGAVSYNWEFGDFSALYLGTDTSHVYNWAAPFAVTLIAYDGAGDSSITTQFVTIQDPPFPWFSWTPNPACPGSEVEFQNWTWPAAGNYIWDLGDGNTSTDFQVNHIYSTQGSYTVTMVASNGCGIDSMSQVINITSTAQPNAWFFTSSTTVCPGQPVDFTNWSGNGASTYDWDFGDGNTSTDVSPSHSFTIAATYTVELIAYNLCSSDTYTFDITVDPTLVPTVFSSVTPNTVCPGIDQNFSSFPSVDVISYLWDFDDGSNSLQQNPTYAYSSSGIYNVSVTVTNFCGNTATTVIAATADVNATPNVSWSYSPFGICPGTIVSFQNYSSDADSVIWDFDDGVTSNEVEPTHSFGALGSYDVKLVVYNSCGNADSLNQTVTVVDNAAPFAGFWYQPWSIGCYGSIFTFMNFSSDTTNCVWTFGDGDSSFVSNPTHAFAIIGSYTVTLKVTNSCGLISYWSETITVADNIPPSSNFWSGMNIVCPGEEIDFWNNSSDPANSYWDFGDGNNSTEISPSHAYTTPGVYNMSLVITNNCGTDTMFTSITVKSGSTPDFSFTTVCLGNTTNFTDLSSPTPDTWGWDFDDGNIATTQNTSNTYGASGDYDVTLTVLKDGCVNSFTQTVSVTGLNTSSIAIDASCFGDNDGAIDLTVTEGTPSYTFIWNGGSTVEDPSGLVQGSYSVTITDANGCTAIHAETVSEPTAISSSSSVTDLTCNAVAIGAIDQATTGGVSGYSYNWSNGSTSEDLVNLLGGTYNLTVTDASGCVFNAIATVNEPTAIVLTPSTVSSNCGSSDGSATVVATGGTSPYTYLWGDGTATATLSGLAAGVYSVTVTDANGCAENSAIVVSDAGGGSATVTVDANVSCNGLNNGELTATMSGGTTPYSYLWSDSGAQVTSTATGLQGGNTFVTITDALGCKSVASAFVSEPSALTITMAVTHVDCNGGSNGDLLAIAVGGSPGYTYSWSSGGNTQNETNLVAGSYTISIQDANGCTEIVAQVITQPAAMTSTITTTDLACNGDGTGSADLTVTGGVTPYTYLWSDGSGSEDITSLSANSYSVTTTDANGCETAAAGIILEPTAIILSLSFNDATCGSSDGDATVAVLGGTSPYSYVWDAGQLTATATGLSGGLVSVTVSDATGCSNTESTVVNNVGGPTVSVITTQASCFSSTDGDATASASGGTTPYTYAWNDALSQVTASATGLIGGTYNVVVTDNNGCVTGGLGTVNTPGALAMLLSVVDESCAGLCDGQITASVTGGTTPYSYVWNTGSTLGSETSLCSGNYGITITDANGCELVANATVTGNTTLNVTISTSNATCNGADGTATATVVGGVAPYNYNWSDGANTATNVGISGGVYTVTVTDDNGCEASSAGTVASPGAVVDAATVSDATCTGDSDGSAFITVGGGLAPFTYIWGNGTTTATNSGLSAGIYGVTITDSNSCWDALSVLISEPNQVTLNLTTTPDDGTSNGTATVNPAGGTPGYSYSWANGSSTTTVAGLSAGYIHCSVTDANGCMTIDSVEINLSFSVEEVNIENQLLVYPNPIKDRLNVKFTMNGSESPIRLRIINKLGQVVYEHNNHYPRGEHRLNIDLEGHPNGIYMIELLSKQEVQRVQVIKTE